MKKFIEFGERSALLSVYQEKRATLYISNEPILQCALADAIDEAENVNVYETQLKGGGCFICMEHELEAADLLEIVCDAISRVYNTDVSVISNA